MSAGREEDATTAPKSRSICSFPSQWRVLGFKNISPTTTKSTCQSTGCQVPVRAKKRHEPLDDLVSFIFRIRSGHLGGGGPRSLFLFLFLFLPGTRRSSAEPAAIGGRCSVMNGFSPSPSPASSVRQVLETWQGRSSRSQDLCNRADIRIGDPHTLPMGVALPFPLSSNRFTVPPSWTPFAYIWNCPSRVGSTFRSSRASNSVPSPQIPHTGCAWTARAFDLHSGGRERDGDLSVRQGRHCPRSVGALSTPGDTGS